MKHISYDRHRFPPVVIQHAVWLYFRVTPGYRGIEDLLAEGGIDVSRETIRRYVSDAIYCSHTVRALTKRDSFYRRMQIKE